MGYGMKCGMAGGITVKKLWTNPNPAQTFAAQTLVQDMTGYDMFAVVYQYGTNEDVRIRYFQFGTVGSRVGMESFGTGTTLRRRVVQSTQAGFVFEEGYNGSNVLASANVPLEIYGIRGVRI